MPNARPSLAAEARETTGKAVARLRREGQLPAVVYGHGVASSNLTIDGHEFEQLRKHAGPNALIDLKVGTGKAQPVLVHNVQVHPVNRRPLHIDLLAVRMTEELTVDVPLVATGVAQAVELQGGTLLHSIETVKVRALPDHLPQSIEYSIEPLVDFEAAIHVRDLPIPSDVTLLNDPDETVAKVQAPRVEVEEVPEAAEAAEGEAPEGEAAEGTGEAAGSATESGEEGSAERGTEG